MLTGAASGFGEAIAERFSTAGFSVVVADINAAKAEDVASRIGSAIAVECDVTQNDAWVALRERAVAALGGIDVLVNNAGDPRHGCGARP